MGKTAAAHLTNILHSQCRYAIIPVEVPAQSDIVVAPMPQMRKLSPPMEARLEMLSEGVMTPSDARTYMGMSRSQLQRYVSWGALPVVRYERVWVVPKRAMILFMADRLQR